jgi:hypothetical protein
LLPEHSFDLLSRLVAFADITAAEDTLSFVALGAWAL